MFKRMIIFWTALSIMMSLMMIINVRSSAMVNNVFTNSKMNQKEVIAHPSAKEKYWIRRIDAVTAGRANYRSPQIGLNTRDLGGYPTTSGQVVKCGAIFRSDYLNKIGQKGIQKIKRLNINKVVDLRSFEENNGINNYPDPNEGNSKSNVNIPVKYYYYQVNTADQHAKNEIQKKKYGQIYTYGNPFTTYNSTRKSYHQIFQLLLNNNKGAILYHCLAGRDRTGLVSALILSALGVDKRNIYNDFMLTNYYAHKYSYVLQRNELDHFFDTINKNYGSVTNYLRKEIGLTFQQQKN